MRIQILGFIFLAGLASPALAQQPQTIEKRVGKLEAEMRAVQRKVFPDGNIEPEIRPAAPEPEIAGVPATTPLADLTARVDALEAQLATLTNQTEQNTYRLQQLEKSITDLRANTDFRLKELETPAPAAAAATEPVPSPKAPSTQDKGSLSNSAEAEAPQSLSNDPAEDRYNEGYRLWDQKKYAEAQKKLEDVAKRYPKHRRASWARNLLGRAYLDAGDSARAARIFLDNFQTDPKGERAADSLFFLGQSLVKLKKPVEACQVYDELQDVYGATMRDYLKQNLPKARADARCK